MSLRLHWLSWELGVGSWELGVGSWEKDSVAGSAPILLRKGASADKPGLDPGELLPDIPPSLALPPPKEQGEGDLNPRTSKL